MGVPRLGCDWRGERAPVSPLQLVPEDGGLLMRKGKKPRGDNMRNEYVTVCDVKWSSGTLGDSSLVRARAAQKYLARGGL